MQGYLNKVGLTATRKLEIRARSLVTVHPVDNSLRINTSELAFERSDPYPTLNTTRFQLRRFAMNDIERLTSLAREHRIADTTIGIPHPYTPQFARMWIASHEPDWKAGQAFHWAASRQGKHHEPAGYVGLTAIDWERRQAELRFWVGCGTQRRDDGVEWSGAVIDYAVNNLRIDRIYALQLRRHKLAAHVLESLGMCQVGTMRKRVFAEGLMEDVECWAISRGTWCSNRNDQGFGEHAPD